MEMTDKVYVEKEHKDYAKKGVVNTALGLSIGALGLELLRGNNGWNLFGNNDGAMKSVREGGCALTCEDKVELTSAIYQGRIVALNERFADRQVINQEMFGLYKSQIDADFNLYKGQRDQFDVLKNEIDCLKTRLAVSDATEPYKLQIIQNQIECCCKEANWKIGLEAERRICNDEKIICYANSTFAPKGVAQPTYSTTINPMPVFDPLCPCNCNC